MRLDALATSSPGEKRFNHPLVGELELSYNRTELAADPGTFTSPRCGGS